MLDLRSLHGKTCFQIPNFEGAIRFRTVQSQEYREYNNTIKLECTCVYVLYGCQTHVITHLMDISGRFKWSFIMLRHGYIFIGQYLRQAFTEPNQMVSSTKRLPTHPFNTTSTNNHHPLSIPPTFKHTLQPPLTATKNQSLHTSQFSSKPKLSPPHQDARTHERQKQ